MNNVHIMMNSVTTKEQILVAAKKEAKSKGVDKIGMREIAKAESIALGTIYNYFPNKEALILSTISSIWREATNTLNEHSDFISAISNVYNVILTVDSDYSGFLSSHASFLKEKKEGRKEMDDALSVLRKYLASSMDEELRVKIKETMDEDKFSEFVLNNIILSALKKEEPRILKALVFNYIKVKQ